MKSLQLKFISWQTKDESLRKWNAMAIDSPFIGLFDERMKEQLVKRKQYFRAEKFITQFSSGSNSNFLLHTFAGASEGDRTGSKEWTAIIPFSNSRYCLKLHNILF